MVFPAVEPNAAPPVAIALRVFGSAPSRGAPRRGRAQPRAARPTAAVSAALLLGASIAVVMGGLLFLQNQATQNDANEVSMGAESKARRQPKANITSADGPSAGSRSRKTQASETPPPAAAPSRPAMEPAPDAPASLTTAPTEYMLDVIPAQAIVRVSGPGALLVQENGRWRLTIAAPDGETSFAIHVSCPGYLSKESLVFPASGDSKTLRIALTRQMEEPLDVNSPEVGGPDTSPTPPKRSGDDAAGLPAATPRLPPAFDVIWIRNPQAATVAWELELDVSDGMSAKRCDVHARNGLRPSCLSGYHDSSGRLFFAGVWVGDGLPCYAVADVDAFDVTAAFRDSISVN